ncbi:hypothetical protein CRG98_039061 [Punica granatum]|uniref:Uncharacterized protein n=1 Tax=Punica granatum TaxID=22663 RepID=A0A2I0IB00_PUNGR|nr:hypothetical protein CRG98_039061 [Punica granatum]
MPPRKQPTANVKEAPGVESAAALPATVKDPTSGGKADPVIMLSRSVEIMAVDIKQGKMRKPSTSKESSDGLELSSMRVRCGGAR